MPVRNKPVPSPRTDRYEDLLAERVRLGRACIDHAVHKETTPAAAALLREARRVDAQLTRFDRYRWDQLVVVAPAEDDRWHVPGTLIECNLCIRGVDAFLAQVTPVH